MREVGSEKLGDVLAWQGLSKLISLQLGHKSINTVVLSAFFWIRGKLGNGKVGNGKLGNGKLWQQ